MGAVDLGGSKKPGGGGPSWKRPRVHVRIDMTPMVDIAFLLLIFFMVTTVFRAPQTMEMALPENNKDNPVTQIKVANYKLITFYVMRIGDKDSLAFLPGEQTSPKPIPWAVLGDTLLSRRSIAGFKTAAGDSIARPELTVLAKIDPKAAYESLVNIVDQFNVDSITRFSIDRYNTMDDSLMRAVGFTTGGPKDLPPPPETTEM